MRHRGLEVAVRTAPLRALRLLGGFECRVGGAEVRIPVSAELVVAFVALQRNPVDRTVIAGTLWSDVCDERANGNLRSALWRTKKLVPGLLCCTERVVSIAPDVDVDYRDESEWSRRVIHGEATDADVDREMSSHALDLLPGVYDDWVVFERDRYRQRWMHAAERVALELARRGRHAEALDCALAVVAADPLRESAQRVAVQCHVIEHNVVEARRRLSAYAVLVRSELGVEPSPDFMALA